MRRRFDVADTTFREDMNTPRPKRACAPVLIAPFNQPQDIRVFAWPVVEDPAAVNPHLVEFLRHH
jgi:hypothetical protein